MINQLITKSNKKTLCTKKKVLPTFYKLSTTEICHIVLWNYLIVGLQAVRSLLSHTTNIGLEGKIKLRQT